MTEESTQAARYQSLRDYLAVLRRYWLVILIIALLGAAAGYANAARQKAVYQSTSQVVFQDPTQNLNIVGIGANTVQTPGALAELNATTVTGPDVMNRVRRKLHSRQSAQALASAITPTVIAASGLLQIQASGSTPAYAARLANTVANVVVARDNSQTRAKFRQVASTIQRRIARLKLRSPSAGQLSFYEDELARLETLSSFATSAQLAKPGLVPTAPSSPNKSRDTGIGLAIGLLLGIIAAFVRDSMDRRLRAPADFESTFELPVVGHVRNQTMGLVAFMSNGKKGPERLDVDSFRILRRNLEFLDLDKPPRSVVVTSAVAEEGKTTVATSLAMVMAAAGKRTLLVDCDLRRPDLASRMGVELFPGLAEYLAARAQPQEILRTVLFSEQDSEAAAVAVGAGPDEASTGNGASNGGSSTGSGSPLVHSLVCIPAGAVTDRGSELLGSGRFKEFIEQVTSRYDMVILDSSPLLPVADTLEVLPHVDSVLICARESRTTRDQARAARATLDRFPRRPTGIVLTGIKPRGAAYELYAYSYEYSS